MVLILIHRFTVKYNKLVSGFKLSWFKNHKSSTDETYQMCGFIFEKQLQ